MRLSKIKLAGFKSFVDPTTITLPSNLIGIVGPNGCGKSNVIDAVRWVMGETSAKHLRGDSMADVIFNGSTSRKPVGQASIELLFDNSDGTIGGQYASYNEISIKRVVSRDGTSAYYQNGTKCRRRDITDIFLGTGLGPRSYSIIEQGMISRLIEARPEDLRVFLEEAAGISKYKERRRETENRIRHTRENMERLTDLRDELAKQLAHLQRQSRTAEKFKIYKEDERLLKGQLTALRWQTLDNQIKTREGQITEQENQFEATVARLRNIEAEMEHQREEHIEASESFNEVQGRYYGIGADIARVEQSIQHAKERQQQHQQDLRQAEQVWFESQAHAKADQAKTEQLKLALAEYEPALNKAHETQSRSADELNEAESAMHEWQLAWDEFNRRAAEPAQQAEVQRARIQHLEQQTEQLRQRAQRLTEEAQGLSTSELTQEIESLTAQHEQLVQQSQEANEQLEQQQQRITEIRANNQRLDQELNEQRSQLQSQKGRHASLEALQQAALGKDEAETTAWLQEHNLANAKRVAEFLDVESGWELAVEQVLGANLEAVCVDSLESIINELQGFDRGSLTIFATQNSATNNTSPGTLAALLQSKVRAPWPVDALFAGVYTVESLHEALDLASRLAVHESIITRDGVWLGNGWARVAKAASEKSGVLQREQELVKLNEQIGQWEARIEQFTGELTGGREALQAVEGTREELQRQLQQATREQADVDARISVRRGRIEQVNKRGEAIRQESTEVNGQLTAIEQELQSTRSGLHAALGEMETLTGKRQELSAQRDAIRQTLEMVREAARTDRDATHEIAIKVESIRTELTSIRQNQQRMESQMAQIAGRRDELQKFLDESEAPLNDMAQELEQYLQQRVQVEAQLSEARRRVEELDHAMREKTNERHEVEQAAEVIRSELDKMRMAWQEIKVRRATLEESLDETGFQLQQLFEEMPEGANEGEWQEKVDDIGRRIQRLGPINLAAIDEYKTQSERKEYLDAQNEDLTEALSTLENAIKKIDRETRTRFKETYDKVDSGFKELFPRLFGGGHAYLELTGEDLLDTGVTVMARPPGKRNSSIHLLSGGEKALTAVALVFSIFQLNPAPFCMLDEVDAPLDDANVGRFCEMVKEMSEKVQFITITHNKITMEMSNQLNGVTMQEPGVSRIVAVDMEEAVEMVAV